MQYRGLQETKMRMQGIKAQDYAAIQNSISKEEES